jgi:hypothetical protein
MREHLSGRMTDSFEILCPVRFSGMLEHGMAAIRSCAGKIFITRGNAPCRFQQKCTSAISAECGRRQAVAFMFLLCSSALLHPEIPRHILIGCKIYVYLLGLSNGG